MIKVIIFGFDKSKKKKNLEELSNYQPLDKNAASWTWLVIHFGG
jgi:hypothetical protein